VAAQICEVLRNPHISKNAGTLDTPSLQRKIREALARSEPFDLAIAWGQPKRTAGGLKTLGPFADLAEMYAIANLVVVVEVVAKLARRPVGLKVLTGGRRFFSALFTRPQLAVAYDAQRQSIADALAGPGVIALTPFLHPGAEHEQESEAWRARFDEALADVTDGMIESKFGTVLLNIDWDHVLAPSAQERHYLPHNIPLPASIDKWLQERDLTSRNRLVRAAIGSLVFPRHQSEWFETFNQDEEVLEDAIAFIHAVAWESTRRYIALHVADADDVASSASDSNGANVLRLTVHEKRDRRDIPAIFTLGPKGGNQLSQHVMAAVSATGEITFGSFAEYSGGQVVPIRLRPEESYALFDWLASAGQPLCLIEASERDSTDRICAAFTSNQAGS
jgi:hypothetical protein